MDKILSTHLIGCVCLEDLSGLATIAPPVFDMRQHYIHLPIQIEEVKNNPMKITHF
ncbi:hypothetical protein SAMN05444412_11027 [Rhodonellum ikkaensis]|uniref:Uncharacterized protein n=1 Tax=Rhodonellum ikkaensis TaxID=336829 RepID=A0A1H3S231_9BACT|nr:hypothetical protein SAMN05444412_11027 [Rhodonellum ikkaensis]